MSFVSISATGARRFVVSLVSREFAAAAASPGVWPRVTFKVHIEGADARLTPFERSSLAWLRKRAPGVQELTLQVQCMLVLSLGCPHLLNVHLRALHPGLGCSTPAKVWGRVHCAIVSQPVKIGKRCRRSERTSCPAAPPVGTPGHPAARPGRPRQRRAADAAGYGARATATAAAHTTGQQLLPLAACTGTFLTQTDRYVEQRRWQRSRNRSNKRAQSTWVWLIFKTAPFCHTRAAAVVPEKGLLTHTVSHHSWPPPHCGGC